MFVIWFCFKIWLPSMLLGFWNHWFLQLTHFQKTSPFLQKWMYFMKNMLPLCFFKLKVMHPVGSITIFLFIYSVIFCLNDDLYKYIPDFTAYWYRNHKKSLYHHQPMCDVCLYCHNQPWSSWLHLCYIITVTQHVQLRGFGFKLQVLVHSDFWHWF